MWVYKSNYCCLPSLENCMYCPMLAPPLPSCWFVNYYTFLKFFALTSILSAPMPIYWLRLRSTPAVDSCECPFLDWLRGILLRLIKIVNLNIPVTQFWEILGNTLYFAIIALVRFVWVLLLLAMLRNFRFLALITRSRSGWRRSAWISCTVWVAGVSAATSELSALASVVLSRVWTLVWSSLSLFICWWDIEGWSESKVVLLCFLRVSSTFLWVVSQVERIPKGIPTSILSAPKPIGSLGGLFSLMKCECVLEFLECGIFELLVFDDGRTDLRS